MMKIIKFRAWDKQRKQMLFHDGNDIRFWRRDNNGIKQVGFTIFAKEIIPMQYTGLNDSTIADEFPDGIEIFEGDILYDPVENLKYLVVWDDNYAVFILKNEDDEKADYDFTEFDTDIGHSLYVIGNIHEHPSLLN